jgi:hypothetical protein
VHDQLAGLRVTQAESILDGDDQIEKINHRLRSRAEQYVELRVAKTRKGGVVRQFEYVYFAMRRRHPEHPEPFRTFGFTHH